MTKIAVSRIHRTDKENTFIWLCSRPRLNWCTLLASDSLMLLWVCVRRSATALLTKSESKKWQKSKSAKKRQTSTHFSRGPFGPNSLHAPFTLWWKRILHNIMLLCIVLDTDNEWMYHKQPHPPKKAYAILPLLASSFFSVPLFSLSVIRIMSQQCHIQ